MMLLSRMISGCGIQALMLALCSCGPSGAPPRLEDIEAEYLAEVGTQLVIVLAATDADGDELFYTYSSDPPKIEGKVEMTRRPDGAGIFRWRPVSADVGEWYFDFRVSDGSQSDTASVKIDVRSAIGKATAPIFRSPSGSGTTLELAREDCLKLDITVDDSDTAELELGQEDPLIGHAELDQEDGRHGTWRWCPRQEQIAADDRYLLLLSADDSDNPKTICCGDTPGYLIVLYQELPEGCPGEGPEIQHTPDDASTLLALEIQASISDDVGLKRPPLFYYALERPSDPPRLHDEMTQLHMELQSGDMQDGTWVATMPNPVADQEEGAEQTIYYVIIAEDDDDPAGTCDHRTRAPASATYEMVVRSPGGSGDAGVCEPCTADATCGKRDDLCVRQAGAAAIFRCGRSCNDRDDCPDDYLCSTSELTSVNGAKGRQCVPSSGDCADPGGTKTCTDDDYEENDTIEAVEGAPALEPGSHDMVSCPGELLAPDDDWYRIVLDEETSVGIAIDGGDAGDLELKLFDADGKYVARSTTRGSRESITKRLVPGTYFIKVFSWGDARVAYELTYTESAQCKDDDDEDDDDRANARIVNSFPYVSYANQICAGDDDWYQVLVQAGDRLEVQLTFQQSDATQDLDLHLHDEEGEDLTPCSESASSTCKPSNGQSRTATEQLIYDMGSHCAIGCYYYVVVHGWNDAENDYDIRIALQ